MALQRINASDARTIRSNIRFVLQTMWEHSRFWSFLAVLTMFASTLGVLLQVFAVRRLIDQVVIDQGFTASVLLWLSLTVLALISIQALSLFGGRIQVKIQKSLDRQFIPRVLHKYQQLPYPRFEDPDSVEMLQRVSENPHADITSTFYALLNGLASLITFVELVIIFMVTSLPIGLLTFLIVGPTVWLDMRSAHREMMQYWHATPEMSKRMYFQQLFINKHVLQEIKVFRNQEFFIDKSDHLTAKINADLKHNIGRALYLKTGSAVLLMGYYAFFFFALTRLFTAGGIGLGLFVALITMLGNFYAARAAFAGSISQTTRLSQGVSHLRRFLDLEELPASAKLMHPDPSAPLVRFEGVHFTYPGSETPVLKDVSFEIAPGEHVAFVGANGSGKSTLIKLLCGMYRPDHGRILIGGVDISSLSTQDLQKVISVIFQDSQRYELTLRENVALGSVDRMDDDVRIRERLGWVNEADDDLMTLPLEQKLGQTEEESTDLSGGQWQRLAIARALYSECDLLVLDEPTAAQDPMAENKLYTLFSGVIRKTDAASIMISHRLASCRLSERILVLADGAIDSIGTHEELMNADGLYADMFQRQSNWYKE